MIARRYSEVDVFSPTPYRGNPLAVVHGAEGLSEEQMQRFAKWTNLAETTFLLEPSDPEADYRVRIFCATHELPFAGHPTLGSAYAWRQAGGQPKNPGHLLQECGAGLVKVRTDGELLAFQAPPLTRYEPLDAPLRAQVAEVLGLDPEQLLDSTWIVNGPQWIGVRLASAQQVLALDPDPADLGPLCIGVIGPHPQGRETQFEVRAFVGDDPVWEDPVTGSLNAGLGRWMLDTGIVEADYVAAQGTAIGYEGRVHAGIEGGDIWIGGQVAACVNGEVRL